VLDLKEEFQRQLAVLGQQQRDQCEQYYKPVLQMLEKLQLQSRPVRAADSMSIRTDYERQEVEQLVKHYRSLPADQRRRFPAFAQWPRPAGVRRQRFEKPSKMSPRRPL